MSENKDYYKILGVSKNADELADNMYSRMIQHDISIDNHSHCGEQKRK